MGANGIFQMVNPFPGTSVELLMRGTRTGRQEGEQNALSHAGKYERTFLTFFFGSSDYLAAASDKSFHSLYSTLTF